MDVNDKPLLDLRDVVKSFGGLDVTNHVSFQVNKGEIRGLIGPNASGKTTLINLISGVHRIEAGAIYFSGKSWICYGLRRRREIYARSGDRCQKTEDR